MKLFLFAILRNSQLDLTFAVCRLPFPVYVKLKLSITDIGRYSMNTLGMAQKKATRYVTIHAEDRRGEGKSLRCRNRAEITVVVCKEKPHPIWS